MADFITVMELSTRWRRKKEEKKIIKTGKARRFLRDGAGPTMASAWYRGSPSVLLAVRFGFSDIPGLSGGLWALLPILRCRHSRSSWWQARGLREPWFSWLVVH